VKATARQPSLVQPALGDFQTDKEEQAEIEAGRIWRVQLWSAMRTFASTYIGTNGLKGLAACAAALDKRWGEDGRPVSESTLGAALRDSERNYFRLEWADWFAARSPEIAELLARRIKPVKTPEQELEDLKAELRSELPKRADAVIRNARAR
jgi:hypothetical protein